ncbi:MAG: cadherin-like domain-containing protein [Pseudonocardiaceae bacterium]
MTAQRQRSAGVLGNDTGGPLTATLGTGPANGTLTLNPNGSFTYTPREGFTGADTFTYTARDGALASASATVTITVGPILPACTITGTAGPTTPARRPRTATWMLVAAGKAPWAATWRLIVVRGRG